MQAHSKSYRCTNQSKVWHCGSVWFHSTDLWFLLSGLMKPGVRCQMMGAHQEQRTCHFISPVKWNTKFLPRTSSLQLLTESKKSPQWYNRYETFPHEMHQWKKRWSLSCTLLMQHHVHSTHMGWNVAQVAAGTAWPDSQVEAANVSPQRRKQTAVPATQMRERNQQREVKFLKKKKKNVWLVVGLNPDRSVSLLFVFEDMQTEAGGHQGASHPNRL